MLLSGYRAIFITIGLIGVILLASPTIALLVKSRLVNNFLESTFLALIILLETFLSILKLGVSYVLYLGVNNNLGSAGYYSCNLKLVNESEFLPTGVSVTPSSIPTLFEYKFFLDDGSTWEAPLVFKVDTDSTSLKLHQKFLA